MKRSAGERRRLPARGRRATARCHPARPRPGRRAGQAMGWPLSTTPPGSGLCPGSRRPSASRSRRSASQNPHGPSCPARRRPAQRQPGTCGSGTPWRFHCPAVARHPDRLAAGLGHHPDLRRENLHPRAHPARARQDRRPGPRDPRVRCRGHDRHARAQAARPRHRARRAGRAAARRRYRPGVPDRGTAGLARPGRGWCSPCSPRCRGWSASTSATALWRATSRPAPAKVYRRRRRH